MKFGLIGLGRIGGGLARQAMKKGHQVVGYDTRLERIQILVQEGLEPAPSLEELVRMLRQQAKITCTFLSVKVIHFCGMIL
jgi:6-phosphogluconate dehydrogenase